MRRSLTILIILSMVFGTIVGTMQEAKAQPTVTVTVTPNATNQIAQFLLPWQQSSAYVDEFRLVFPPAFNLTGAVVNSTTCMISPYYTSDVTLVGNTIIFHYPSTTFISVASQVQITIAKEAKIRNPNTCGPLAAPIDIIRAITTPASTTTEAHFTYTVESTVTINSIVVSPPIVDTASQLTVDMTLGGCGDLVAGDTINIDLPSSYGSYSYTPPDASCVTVQWDPPGPTPPSTFQPASLTKELYPNNRIRLEVPFGITIPLNSNVVVTFASTCNIKTPATADYYKFGVGTSRETFPVQSNRVMIANHVKVTVLGNTVSSVNPEYKIEWTLHNGATLSGDNGDWVEVNFYDASNPAPDNASITNDFTVPAQRPQASSILLSNSSWSWGSQAYYASSVIALGPKTLRIMLPAGFSLYAGGQLVITFLSSAGLINTATAGTYKLQIRHANAPDWIPSDGYAIYDGVVFSASPSVYVSPPTVGLEAGYTVVFQNGALLKGGDTITIAFPNGTTLKNWNSTLAGGSIYLMSGPMPTAGNPALPPFPPANFPGADIVFDPNVECPPVRNPAFNYPTPLVGPRPLDLNAAVTNTYGSGQTVTITIPNGFTAPSGNWIAIRFCKSAGLINPSTAGQYTLQIKTSTQPAYAISTPYLVTTTASAITVTPNPNGTCAQNVEYKVQFTPGIAGDLRGDAGDFVDLAFYDPTNPAPDYASIQNVFQSTTPPPVAITDSYAYVSPPFVNWSSRWDVFFKTGTALASGTDTITITFPPTVRVPTTFAANTIYVSTQPMPLLDPPLPGAPATAVAAANITVTGQIVRIVTPTNFAAGDTVYLRIESTAGIQNPSGANASYTIYLESSTQTYKVPTYFGITDDYNYVPTGNAPSVNPQWRGHDLSIVPTVFPSTTASPAQYDLALTSNTGSGCSITAASVLILEFPPGTIIPNTIPANSVRVSANPPPFNFGQEVAVAGNTVTATANPSTRTITLTNFAGGPYTDMFIRIYSSAGIINPSNPSATLQINMSLTNSGCIANEGITVPSEFFVITPPRIGGVNIPSQSVYMLGGYYYVGFQNNWVSKIDVLPGMGNLKTLRVWIPAGVQLQQGQQSTIVFTGAAGLVNTCTAGSYVLSLRTSKEMTWIKSSPYAIVDAVQFVCGSYPKATPPTVSQTAQYDVSFTVGPMGGLKADVDTITIAFPSMTTFNGGGFGSSGSIPAGSIYVSTSPIVGTDCPPPAPAVACKFNGTVNMQAVTITTPIPIGNGQTVYIRFCKSAGITNPYTAGAYNLQVKTSMQNTYAVSCLYAIGTAVSNVEVTPVPDATCNQNVEYQVKLQVGQSGGLSGDNSDYVEIDFADPSIANSASISNNFRLSSPSPSSIMFYPGYYSYGYGGKPASQVLVLSETKLRVYLPSGFTVGDNSQMNVVFTAGSRLNNTCTPGSYKVYVSTSKELTPVASKPYSIVDAVTFNSGIPVEVVPPVVNLEAQYTLTFDVSATGGLTANSGTITVAFPTGTTVPYQMSPGTIWVANGQFNANTSCPPTAPVGVNFAQVVIPPTVSGQIVTFTTPINIPNGGRVTVRFCRQTGIKNPYTAGAYQLQVKTSSQPAYATSYPYAIITALSGIKVTPNPNIICTEDTEYKIDFTNSASGNLNGDLGDYIEVQFDDPRNPTPDYASIQNNFSATNTVTGVHVEPLANPIASELSRWDINFRTGIGGSLVPGDTISIDFPSSTSFNSPFPAASIWISDSPWTDYGWRPSNNSTLNTSANTFATTANVIGTNVSINIPAGFSVPDNGNVYIRFMGNTIFNPAFAGTHVIQLYTSKQTTPASSNYFGTTIDNPIPGGAVPVNTNYVPFSSVLPFSPKVYPQTANSVAQVDLEFTLVNALTTPGSVTQSVAVSFELGFSVPTMINATSIWMAVNGEFVNCKEGSNDPSPSPPFYPLTSPPTISGNTVTMQVPAALIPAMVAGASVEIQFRPSAGIRNPPTTGTDYVLSVTTYGNDAPLANYGNFTDSENIAITPTSNPLGASSIQSNQIILGSTWGGVGVNPSSVVVIGNKALRIYLPLGYTIGASAQSSITFLPSAHLRNTCTPGNYILKLRTSKDPVYIDSSPYSIVAAVRDITVRAVPPVVSTVANYTIVFTDTSTTGLKKDRDTITIAFPSETVIPQNMSAGSIYVARTADFSNDVCPPTHPGSYGVHYAPLNAPPVISGNVVTITVPININAGELISVRFCESAGITNPGYAKYYTLQVMTSAQPQYAISLPYPIVTGLNKPKVTVVPNIISRTTCQPSEMTITFNTGMSGKLTRGTNRIFVAIEMDPNHVLPGTNRGYYMPTSFMQIDANCITVNGTQATANANVYQNPTGSRVPRPMPTFTNMAVIEVILPVDVGNSTEVKLVFKECSGLCNPYVSGNYTVAVWTDVENTANESEIYAILNSVMIVNVDVQPPTVSTKAQYTIEFVTYATVTADLTTITVTFPSDTTIPSMMMPGHIKVDDDAMFGSDATPPLDAKSPVTINGRSITFVCPYSFVSGSHIWVRFDVESGIINPSTEGPYTLKLRTSAQPNDAESSPYYITLALGGATVTVTPPISKYVNAEYQIDWDISDKGSLTKDVSSIKISFPDNDIYGYGGGYAAVGSTLPTSVAATNIYINETQCRMNANIDYVNRIITVFTPVTVDAKGHVKIVIKPGAGMRNPITGSYRLRLQTSVEPIWIETNVYQIYSTLGGPIGGRNPSVAVSYLVSNTTMDALAGAVTVNVDQTLGWVTGIYAAVGDLTDWFDAQVVQISGVGTGSLTFAQPLAKDTPAGTPFFYLKTFRSTLLAAAANPGDTTITVNDAKPFVGEQYVLVGPTDFTAELHRIASVDLTTNIVTLDPATPIVGTFAAGANVFKFVNNVGIVNEEAYYNISFMTGSTGNLTGGMSTITITFPDNTTVPSGMTAQTVKISTDNIIYRTCDTVVSDSAARSITVTTPIDIGANGAVYIAIYPQSGLRNPKFPGTFRLKVRTSSESVDVESLAYYMEGNGAPQVEVDPCIKGEVGAKYTITFSITQRLPVGSHIFITFPQDTVLPSVLRQENVLLNGMAVVDPITVTTSTLQVDITTPKDLPASQPIEVTFLKESRIKNPSSFGYYRLKVRTNLSPNNVDVQSVDYVICNRQTPDSIVLIPGCPISFTPGQSKVIQAQLKDVAGVNIDYGVDYNWFTTIGSISGISGGSMTLTAPASSGTGTLTVEATYQGTKKTQTCSINISAPLGTVSVTPPGPMTLNFGAVQVFGGQAVDSDGANINSGVVYKWSVTGGIGSITPSSGQQTTFTAGQSSTSGSVTCEASYAGVTKSYSVTINVVSSGGSGGGGGGGGGGSGGGGTPTTLIKATIDPNTVQAQTQIGGITFTLTALGDLSGGEIRITFPSTWANPTVDKMQFPAADGVTIGTVTYSGTVMIIPITTMTAGKAMNIVWLNPPPAPAPNNYVFTVVAKKPGTADPSPASPQPLIVATQGTGPVSADGTGLCVVTPDIVSAGSTGVKLTFVFTAQMDLTDGRMQITIPRDWTQPTQTEGSKGFIRVVNSDGDVPTVQVLQNGLVEFMFMKFLKNHKLTFEYSNVDVPGDEKTDSFIVKTGSGTGVPKAIVNQPQVKIQKSGISGLALTPKPSAAGSPSAYEIRFKTSSAGTLTKGAGTIYLQFPVDTFIPTTIQPSMIKVQSTEAVAAEANQPNRSLLITVGTDIPSNSTVVIQISDQSGIKNPTVPGNEYKLTAKTSSDGSLVQSSSYVIDASKVTAAKVTPDPVITAANAQYTIVFSTGAGGRLVKAQDKIILEFRNDTYIPPNILPTQVTINGKILIEAVQVDSIALKVILPVPDAIPENSEVKIVFSKDAGIKNPTKSGSYTMYVSTTKETIRVESETYMIGQSQVSTPKVTLSSNTAAAKCVDYTIEFTTGQFGSLTPASTITIWFHPSYSLGTVSEQRISINGQAALKPSTKQNQGTYLTFSPPSSIGPNSNVKIVLKCFDNPTTSATYHLQVATSAEPTYINSNDYKVGEILSTLAVINPNSPTGDFGWYKDKPSVTLTNNQPTATMFYSIDGGEQKRYTGVPVVIEYGQHTFEYWSTDPNFQDEPRQTLGTIKVDNVKPKFTITEPKDSATVTTGQIKVKGTYEEDFIYEVAYGDFANPSAPMQKTTPSKDNKTFEFTYTLLKGSNSINIVLKDEAGNTSFEPPLTVIYNPVSQPTVLITSPQDNSEPTGGVTLVAEATKGQYHLEAKTDITGSIDGDIVKLEVSTDTAPSEWIPLTLDTTMKKVTGTPGLKVKAGKNILTFRATDSNGKTYTWTKILNVNVSLRFDNVKSYDPKKDKTVGIPDRTTFNDVPFKTTDGAYPVIVGSRTLVPFRLLGNAFGAKVSYNDATKTATYEFEGKTVSIVQGSNKATVTVNGQSKQVQIDTTNASVTPMNINNRLYVPLRFVSENLGWNINYITATRTVQVCYPAACKP